MSVLPSRRPFPLTGAAIARRFPGLLLAMALLVEASAPPCLRSEEPESAAERREQLLALIAEASKETDEAPRVLADVDPRSSPVETLRIARALRETRLDLKVENEEVPRLLELLAAGTGLNFVMSGAARKAIAEETPRLSASLRAVSAENTLDLLRSQLPAYRFAIRYGAVMLLRREELPAPRTLRVYSVEDLVRPRRDFPAPRLALEPREK